MSEELKVIRDEDKTVEQLATEANTIYGQIEQIGQIGCVLMAQTGEKLNIAKSKVPHGQWEDWVRNNLTFSPRKARYMMQYAEKAQIEGGVFSNRQMFADLAPSKIYALLGEDEAVVSQIITSDEVKALPIEEYKEEIKRLRAENEAIREEKKSLEEANKSLEEAKEELEETVAKPQISYEELKKAQEKAEKAEQMQKEAEQKLKEAKDKYKQAQEKAKADKEKEAEALKKSVTEEVRKDFEKKEDAYRKAETDYKAQIAKLQKSLDNNSNKDVAAFKFIVEGMQRSFNDAYEIIERAEPAQSEKMKCALSTVMHKLAEMTEQ